MTDITTRLAELKADMDEVRDTWGTDDHLLIGSQSEIAGLRSHVLALIAALEEVREQFAANIDRFGDSLGTLEVGRDGFDTWLTAHDAQVAAQAVRDAARYARPDGGDHVGMTRSEAEAFEDALTLVEEYADRIEAAPSTVHDARIAREAAERAWDEGHTAGYQDAQAHHGHGCQTA